ncbi:TonB-dependent receptor [Caulobacter vibrioides]|uniref:TonB-dependent receptor, putative n=2 Tax=Caulobacter vibrioides TaxID=155892 RepID=Q9A9I1_CAUVC|nr:TonB-dependent receptor [Caulobacter vibrioides]YP_002516424.1 TonB-dependent receptor [Caulobacter vibrioides NA1000]AAK22983.1 TonB-dependent receptor, putative [Caulobacter vibrioides CB15]ACL94516.1 TonB-dependent receptor [Caulobacter vibrioides NA1000]ATC27834.1 TonB-dependent receptor [Caulobacter vibrioides]QXZ53077.1 TonB-dependent receptor [Caulobacter vibrioides]
MAMKRLRRLHASASCVAITAAMFASPVLAQQAQNTTVDEIIVTGIRASLERSIEIKRTNSGVVDAISAEDMGKFPDTNLAESLQRITGVSIDRTNGEGSQVTVRGFGGGFNLVTLNGRTMPTANVATVGGDQSSDTAGGTSRSFDFSNLASEGVTTLEVYKTGRAAVPSGGIGAAINVKTRRPLDGKPGLTGSVGVKAVYDQSMDKKVDDGGSKITPEFSGLLNWADDSDTFGVALFGAYQKRDFTSRSVTSNDWNIRPYSDFINPANGFVRNGGATQITNAPSSGSTLVAIPNDSRYHFSQGERERINGQLTAQYRPTENLTITADALYAVNKSFERRNDSTNWFNRPFDRVTFDNNPVVATAVLLQEQLSGTKDMGFEQQYRSNEDTLESYGLSADWDLSDRLRVKLDGHISKADSGPHSRNGTSSTTVSIGAPIVAAHSVDYSGKVPVQSITINDAAPRGNGNGALDAGDLGSQVARTWTNRQQHDIKEVRADVTYDLDDNGSRFDFGLNYRTSKMVQSGSSTQQDLGSWGISNPRDVQQFAPGLVKAFCMACQFNEFDLKQSGAGLVSFRADAIDLYNAMSKAYVARGNPVNITGQANNRVDEDILAGYAQVTWKSELGGMPATLVTGVRYEQTEVTSTSLVRTPSAIIWTADNDFSLQTSATYQPLAGKGKYNNLLPALDFSLDLRDDLVGRFSFSRTIARPDYGNLFAAQSAGTPNRPVANGAIPLGSSGNPDLEPLISDNFDVSLEWYYKPSSYITAGFFEKRVNNFVGTGTVSQNLFGLRDVSSGAAGTRSGNAKAILTAIGADQTDVNLFTMTALLQTTGSAAAAQAQFQANRGVTGDLNQAFVDQILAAVDLSPNSTDPLFNFQVSKPINNRTGKIHGFEIAAQHFFGDTGFGVSGAYTMVRGDVAFNNGASPSQDQFALLGLSDTANATLIYDKNGISARIAYNWRDKFLAATNRGGSRNPVYTAPFGQLDINVSYDVTPKLAISLEGINLTKESLRTYARDENQLWFAQELDRRILLGARYRF